MLYSKPTQTPPTPQVHQVGASLRTLPSPDDEEPPYELKVLEEDTRRQSTMAVDAALRRRSVAEARSAKAGHDLHDAEGAGVGGVAVGAGKGLEKGVKGQKGVDVKAAPVTYHNILMDAKVRGLSRRLAIGGEGWRWVDDR